jgi:hypothetical protein
MQWVIEIEETPTSFGLGMTSRATLAAEAAGVPATAAAS